MRFRRSPYAIVSAVALVALSPAHAGGGHRLGLMLRCESTDGTSEITITGGSFMGGRFFYDVVVESNAGFSYRERFEPTSDGITPAGDLDIAIGCEQSDHVRLTVLGTQPDQGRVPGRLVIRRVMRPGEAVPFGPSPTLRVQLDMECVREG